MSEHQYYKQYEPTVSEMTPAERIATLQDALVGFIPDDRDRKSFERLIRSIPEPHQPSYFTRLKGHLAHSSEVASKGGVRSMLYELGLVHQVMCEGLEQLDFDAVRGIGSVSFSGYSRHADLRQPPDKQFSSTIEVDVPIIRRGKPYVYEAKTYFRTAFGSTANDRNQLLKYQAAIHSGQISGATIRAKGCIDDEFLQWVIPAESPSPVPDIEILYAVALPSSKPYTTVLKPGKQTEGLRYHNPVPTDSADIEIAECLEIAREAGILGGTIATASKEMGRATNFLKPEDIENRKQLFLNNLYGKLTQASQPIS